MEMLIAEFRTTVEERFGGRSARGRIYGPDLRRLAVTCARQGAAEGISRSEIAARLGVHIDTLREWLAAEKASGAASGNALVPVRLIEDSASERITLHGPCGVRVDRMRVSDLAALLRALQ